MLKLPRTKREHLRRLVEDKNKWSRPLTDEEKTIGFLGWHQRGYLPHCDFPNLAQFVTFRLGDSMPAARRGEWEELLKIEDVRERRTKLEEYLDLGLGECKLRDGSIARMIEESLRHFHKCRYELLSWCVMPNHVHVLVDVRMTPLWKIVATWKKFSSRYAGGLLPTKPRFPNRRESVSTELNRSLALRAFWQREYWDTFMRDEEQQQKAFRYIENNPVKAKLCRTTKDWPFSSARLRDEFDRLVL